MQTEETHTTPRRVDIEGAVDAVDATTLGGRIAFARMRKGMTQKELAALIPNKKGESKSRATIVQYENDNIMPPLDVVKLIADQLEVSPSYLAFGEHVVSGLSHKATTLVPFPVISVGRDGEFVSSTMAFSEEKVKELGTDKEHIKAYVLPHDASAFSLGAGDIMITDSNITEPTDEGGLYVIKTKTGMSVISIDPHYSSTPRGKTIAFKDSAGRALTAKVGELQFLGEVISTVRSDRR